MAVQVNFNWPTCSQEECIGIRLDAGKCLAHAGDEERDAALNQLSETGKIDARGVTISNALLEKILHSARGPGGHRTLKEAVFGKATFEGEARFGEATFKGEAVFGGATFEGGAVFERATFKRRAMFRKATFEGEARFGEATFKGGAYFDGATFEGEAVFGGATFKRRAMFRKATFKGKTRFDKATFKGGAFFDGATFEGEAVFGGANFEGGAYFGKATFEGETRFDKATFKGETWFGEATFKRRAMFVGATFEGETRFDKATFKGEARFGEATFKRRAMFVGATFEGETWFDKATFKGEARFDRATFERAQQFGPVLAHRGLNLDGVQFAQPVRIEASTTGLCCRRARFPGGVQFRLRWARVVLDDTDPSAPSLLTGIPRLASDEMAAQEQRIARAWQRRLAGQISEQPRLLSLRRANVAGLGLANVNLADCRFAGAHNLDKLRLEADVAFRLSPARVGWEQRQVIAEESAWRSDEMRSGRWTAPRWPDWAGGEKPAALNPGAIAGLYRALRKSREDAKDEPGAADFYYGEMEMRRHAHGQPGGSDGARGRVDRGVLTAYWLVSGYGLRAWRALAWLAGITVAFAVAFHLVGFIRPPQPASYWTSLLYAFRSTISLTDDKVTLTAWGQLLQALLRLTGPVLLGLTLLALRGRVRR
jgi:uncharacterized protein YjbI with pentapeptide repeats